MNMLLNAIKLRAREWQYFAAGKITFLQALSSMPPSSMRSKSMTEVQLFGKPYTLPMVNVGFFVDFVDQIVERDQYGIGLIRDGATVIDAGANLGIFSIFAAVRHPDATILAFEPTPDIFGVLKKNAELYPNIKVFNCALGDRDGAASLVLTGHGGGVENHIGDGGVPISMKRIDSLGVRADFIKIDTEGFEKNIISGAAETIRKYKPVIAMSAYHRPEDKEKLPRLLNGIAPYYCELRHDAEEDLICVPMADRPPFVSVIVGTFNRGKVISECLQSLAEQTYPKDRYEVIVVDDGSTDDTAQLVQKQKIARFVGCKTNLGPSSARNAGINIAKGEIIACIDDDAVADREWLWHLVVPFSSPTVSACGGQVVAYKTEHFAERYLSAIGNGNPIPLSYGKSKNPLRRFAAYLEAMFEPKKTPDGSTEVQAAFGVNVAYRKAVIQEFGNFDPVFRYDEDTDVALRLREHGKRTVYVPDAIVRHRHRDSIRKLLSQTYRNAWNTLYLYAKEKKILPIFPFPIFYLAISLLLLAVYPFAGIIFIVIGPDILYAWWPIRAFRERRTEYLAYGYIQLCVEFAAIAGFVAWRRKAADLKDKSLRDLP